MTMERVIVGIAMLMTALGIGNSSKIAALLCCIMLISRFQ